MFTRLVESAFYVGVGVGGIGHSGDLVADTVDSDVYFCGYDLEGFAMWFYVGKCTIGFGFVVSWVLW